MKLASYHTYKVLPSSVFLSIWSIFVKAVLQHFLAMFSVKKMFYPILYWQVN